MNDLINTYTTPQAIGNYVLCNSTKVSFVKCTNELSNYINNLNLRKLNELSNAIVLFYKYHHHLACPCSILQCHVVLCIKGQYPFFDNIDNYPGLTKMGKQYYQSIYDNYKTILL